MCINYRMQVSDPNMECVLTCITNVRRVPCPVVTELEASSAAGFEMTKG